LTVAGCWERYLLCQGHPDSEEETIACLELFKEQVAAARAMIEAFAPAPALASYTTDATKLATLQQFYDEAQQLGGPSLYNLNSKKIRNIRAPVDRWLWGEWNSGKFYSFTDIAWASSGGAGGDRVDLHFLARDLDDEQKAFLETEVPLRGCCFQRSENYGLEEFVDVERSVAYRRVIHDAMDGARAVRDKIFFSSGDPEVTEPKHYNHSGYYEREVENVSKQQVVTLS